MGSSSTTTRGGENEDGCWWAVWLVSWQKFSSGEVMNIDFIVTLILSPSAISNLTPRDAVLELPMGINILLEILSTTSLGDGFAHRPSV